jgi:translation initiation factor 1
MPDRSRLVYSTDRGRICPDCGQPAADCQCRREGVADEPVPDRIAVVLRIESRGRGGKTVTVVERLPDNAAFLDELAGVLKRSCATGGTVRRGAIELAGDVRDRVRPLLVKRGWSVRG